MWQFTGPSTAWNLPPVLVECYFFSRSRGLLAHRKRKMCVTYAKNGKKGCSWILYSEKHLVLRLLRWKPFFHPPTMLYKHRWVTSAVQQVSYHFRIYKGSKALDYFPLKCCSITLGALACFLVFWQFYVLQLVFIVHSCFCSKTVQPLSRKARRGRSTCGALCPVSALPSN